MTYDQEEEVFECPKMKNAVTLTWKFRIKATPASEPDLKIPDGFDCNHKNKCGVAEISAMVTRYDWKKCVHPKVKETAG